MTNDQAFYLGYEMAADPDWEGDNLEDFTEVVVSQNQEKISAILDNVYPEIVKGIEAHWNDCISNGAIVHKDDADA